MPPQRGLYYMYTDMYGVKTCARAETPRPPITDHSAVYYLTQGLATRCRRGSVEVIDRVNGTVRGLGTPHIHTGVHEDPRTVTSKFQRSTTRKPDERTAGEDEMKVPSRSVESC